MFSRFWGTIQSLLAYIFQQTELLLTISTKNFDQNTNLRIQVIDTSWDLVTWIFENGLNHKS